MKILVTPNRRGIFIVRTKNPGDALLSQPGLGEKTDLITYNVFAGDLGHPSALKPDVAAHIKGKELHDLLSNPAGGRTGNPVGGHYRVTLIVVNRRPEKTIVTFSEEHRVNHNYKMLLEEELYPLKVHEATRIAILMDLRSWLKKEGVKTPIDVHEDGRRRSLSAAMAAFRRKLRAGLPKSAVMTVTLREQL